MPTEEGWELMDRTLTCGVQPASGQPTSSPVDLSAQYFEHPVGTCLALDSEQRQEPTDCGAAHHLEVVGHVEVPADGYPGTEALNTSCLEMAERYTTERFNYSVIDYDDRSHASGRRTAMCVIGVAGDVFGWGTRTAPFARS